MSKPIPPPKVTKVLRVRFNATDEMPCIRSNRINMDSGDVMEMDIEDKEVQETLLRNHPENFTKIGPDDLPEESGIIKQILPKRDQDQFHVIESAIRMIRNNESARRYGIDRGLVLMSM